MRDELNKLLENSYAPYSHFHVACIVVMKDGKKFYGVNVENASFGATVCAERNAIFGAVSHGYKKGDFDSIYIMNSSKKIATPCFLCRQVILEFFDDNANIFMMDQSTKEISYKVKDLCPYPFDENNLKG